MKNYFGYGIGLSHEVSIILIAPLFVSIEVMGVYAIWMRMVGITTGLFKTLIFDVFLKTDPKEQYSFGLTF